MGGPAEEGVLGKAQNNHTNAGNKNMAQNKEEQKENSKGFVWFAVTKTWPNWDFFGQMRIFWAKCGFYGAHWGSWAHRGISQCCGLSPLPHPRPLALAVCSCDAEVVVRRQTAGLPDLVWHVTERLRSLTVGLPRPSQHLEPTIWNLHRAPSLRSMKQRLKRDKDEEN